MARPKKSGTTAKKATKKSEEKQDQFVDTNEMMQTAETVEQLPEIGLEQPKQKQAAEIEKQVQEPQPQPQQIIQEIKPADLPKEEEIEVKYNPSENDTREMLDFVGITSIPKFQKSAVWVKAIAKVLKIDTSVSWVVLKRTGAKTHNIEKIFGHCAAIKKVGTPIPIEVIPYNYSAAFPQNSTYEMAKFISNYSELTVDELQHKTYEELTDMMLDLQIKMYYEDIYKNEKTRIE
jgi:hypothetical protein